MTKWTPEFEEMWRCRLREADDDKQFFREFIKRLIEIEIIDAFKSALDEIDRLRKEQTIPVA